MGKLMDELKYRTGACSFEWAEEYEAKKREARPYNQYRVQIDHHAIKADTVVNSQSPSDALNAVVDNILATTYKLDKSQYNLSISHESEYNPFHTNVKVTKVNGIKRVSWYGLRLERKEAYNARIKAEQERADWARREQYQGIY